MMFALYYPKPNVTIPVLIAVAPTISNLVKYREFESHYERITDTTRSEVLKLSLVDSTSKAHYKYHPRRGKKALKALAARHFQRLSARKPAWFTSRMNCFILWTVNIVNVLWNRTMLPKV
jgi:hypothetical protein